MQVRYSLAFSLSRFRADSPACTIIIIRRIFPFAAVALISRFAKPLLYLPVLFDRIRNDVVASPPLMCPVPRVPAIQFQPPAQEFVVLCEPHIFNDIVTAELSNIYHEGEKVTERHGLVTETMSGVHTYEHESNGLKDESWGKILN
jgi:hypothetical protein